jgi:hypothetical protein
LPVTIPTGSADREAPSEHCTDWLVSQNKSAQRHDLGSNVGHYTFLDEPSDTSLVGKVDIISDLETVDRMNLHQQAANIGLNALE